LFKLKCPGFTYEAGAFFVNCANWTNVLGGTASFVNQADMNHRFRALTADDEIIEHTQAIYPALSLNMRADNPSVRLYEQAGFVKMAGSEKINRVGDVSFNRIRNLQDH